MGFVANFRYRRAEHSLCVIYAAKEQHCSAGVKDSLSALASCPLRMAGMTSMPASGHRAAQNDLKPTIGRTSRLTREHQEPGEEYDP